LYGPPQAGKLENDKLKVLLQANNYYPTKYTPGFWTHKRKDMYLSLVVDGFGANTPTNQIRII